MDVNLLDVIIRPIITEKSTQSGQDNNTVTFEVKKTSNKTEIKQAVEKIFEVKVEKVNIVNEKSKTKRVGKYEGKTKAKKKAIVKLKEGHSIDIFAEKMI